MNQNTRKAATVFAILAAALYAVNIPLSKLLLEHVGTTMMAAFLYLGAGTGLLIYSLGRKFFGKGEKQEPLTRKEFPFTIGMVVLDILAPIFLMLGIAKTNSANASLLNNFEIVATSLIAFVIFKEKISKRLWTAIALVVAASMILSFEGAGAFVLNEGSLFVLAASVCWGLENNCTNKISHKSATGIVIIKGWFSGLGSLFVAFAVGEELPDMKWMVLVLLLGFVSYGLSIRLYIRAQNGLGAAKTSAFYSIAPFLGVAFGMMILGERPGLQFYVGLVIMVVSTVLMVKDTLQEKI